MNHVIETIKGHRSYRKYKDILVEEEKISAVIQSAQSAPSWVHGQQMSVIVVRDQAKKSKLAKLVGNQKHVEEVPVFLVFCADFHRAQIAGQKQGKELRALHDLDILLVGATDVGLAMGNAIAAANSLDLGTVPIGGIRRKPLEVIELLELPKYVIPIAGLCLGYPDGDSGQKPRLPKAVVCHDEVYHDHFIEQLDQYDEVMSEFTKKQTKDAQSTSWSERVASFYENTYYEDVDEMLERQGFSAGRLIKR